MLTEPVSGASAGGSPQAAVMNFLKMAPQVAHSRASLRHLAQVGLDLAAQVEATPVARTAPDHSDWQLLQARGLNYRIARVSPPTLAPCLPRQPSQA